MFNRVGVSTGAQVGILPVPDADTGSETHSSALGPFVRLRLVNHRCHRARLPLAGRTPSSKRRLDARGVVG